MYIQKLSTLQSEKMKRRNKIHQLHIIQTTIKSQKFKSDSDVVLLASIRTSIKELAPLQVKNRQKKNAIVQTMRSNVDAQFFGRKFNKIKAGEHGKKALFQRYAIAPNKAKFFETESKRISKGSMSYNTLGASAKRQVRKERNYLQKLMELHAQAV